MEIFLSCLRDDVFQIQRLASILNAIKSEFSFVDLNEEYEGR